MAVATSNFEQSILPKRFPFHILRLCKSVATMRVSPGANCFSTTLHSRAGNNPITVEVEARRSTANGSPPLCNSRGGVSTIHAGQSSSCVVIVAQEERSVTTLTRVLMEETVHRNQQLSKIVQRRRKVFFHCRWNRELAAQVSLQVGHEKGARVPWMQPQRQKNRPDLRVRSSHSGFSTIESHSGQCDRLCSIAGVSINRCAAGRHHLRQFAGFADRSLAVMRSRSKAFGGKTH